MLPPENWILNKCSVEDLKVVITMLLNGEGNGKLSPMLSGCAFKFSIKPHKKDATRTTDYVSGVITKCFYLRNRLVCLGKLHEASTWLDKFELTRQHLINTGTQLRLSQLVSACLAIHNKRSGVRTVMSAHAATYVTIVEPAPQNELFLLPGLYDMITPPETSLVSKEKVMSITELLPKMVLQVSLQRNSLKQLQTWVWEKVYERQIPDLVIQQWLSQSQVILHDTLYETLSSDFSLPT
jgi:hypothetical protein